MEEIDLKELIDMFLRKKFLILFVVTVFAALGAIYTLEIVVPKYDSTTTLILVQTSKGKDTSASAEDTEGITTADLTLNSKLVENYKEISVSRRVLNKVIENLKLNTTYPELKKQITVSTKTDAELISITVKDADTQLAGHIANEIAKVFVQETEELFGVKNVHILDEAVVSYIPYNINLFKNIVIFAFVGGILVFADILLVNMLDTTIKTDSDVEKATGLPVLATIVFTDMNSKSKKTSKTSRSSKSSKVSEDIPANIATDEEELEEEDDNNTISMFSYLNDSMIDDDSKS